MNIRARDIFLIPNLLTIARLVFLSIPAYLISQQDPSLRPWILFCIAIGIATDILDGYLARRLNQVSDLGKVLDPVSDKTATAILVIALNIYSDFPLWAVILVLGRDVIVLVLSIFFIRSKHAVLTSNIIGKPAALSWGLVILVWILDIDILKTIFRWSAVGLVAVSAYSYGKRFILSLANDSSQKERTSTEHQEA
jgi:CDP-diacylglycerol--glycerol-3-phosphate 3-phosphatidyltransferase